MLGCSLPPAGSRVTITRSAPEGISGIEAEPPPEESTTKIEEGSIAVAVGDPRLVDLVARDRVHVGDGQRAAPVLDLDRAVGVGLRRGRHRRELGGLRGRAVIAGAELVTGNADDDEAEGGEAGERRAQRPVAEQPGPEAGEGTGARAGLASRTEDVAGASSRTTAISSRLSSGGGFSCWTEAGSRSAAGRSQCRRSVQVSQPARCCSSAAASPGGSAPSA